MSFVKFAADKIFDGYRFYSSDYVLLLNTDGKIEGIVPKSEAGDNVQYFEGTICPGFINCHCHLELSHLKNAIAEKQGLTNFLWQVLQKRQADDETILQAIEIAENEMLTNGIVAVGDICNNTLTVAQKTKGRLFYHNFVEVSGFDNAIATQRFEKAVEIFAAFAHTYSTPMASNSIVPHAPYSVSSGLWQLILNFPGNHLMSIHNQEAAAENELFQYGKGDFLLLFEKMKLNSRSFQTSGKSSLQTFLPSFHKSQSIILVHNVFTSEDDILFAKANHAAVYWCLCPNANLYISNLLPNIELLMQQNCEIVIGTDSLASNHQLSVLSEMNCIRQQNPFIDEANLLRWATSNGAKALQLNSLLGSFEKNKIPAVLLIDKNWQTVARLA